MDDVWNEFKCLLSIDSLWVSHLWSFKFWDWMTLSSWNISTHNQTKWRKMFWKYLEPTLYNAPNPEIKLLHNSCLSSSFAWSHHMPHYNNYPTLEFYRAKVYYIFIFYLTFPFGFAFICIQHIICIRWA